MTAGQKLLLTLYFAGGLAFATGYAAAELLGWEPFEAEEQVVVPSVRTPPGSSGGSGGFWHSGFRGGK